MSSLGCVRRGPTCVIGEGTGATAGTTTTGGGGGGFLGYLFLSGGEEAVVVLGCWSGSLGSFLTSRLPGESSAPRFRSIASMSRCSPHRPAPSRVVRTVIPYCLDAGASCDGLALDVQRGGAMCPCLVLGAQLLDGVLEVHDQLVLRVEEQHGLGPHA